jgi:hypothetical protein
VKWERHRRLQHYLEMVLRSSDPVAELDERVVADDGDDSSVLVVVAAGVILREPVLGVVGLAAPAREPLRDPHLLQAPVRVVRVLGRLLDPLLPLLGLHLPYLGGRDAASSSSTTASLGATSLTDMATRRWLVDGAHISVWMDPRGREILYPSMEPSPNGKSMFEDRTRTVEWRCRLGFSTTSYRSSQPQWASRPHQTRLLGPV